MWLLLKTKNCSPIATEFSGPDKSDAHNYLYSNMLSSGLDIVVRNTDSGKNVN